ncbi:MAG: ABC transporter permease [Vicinamibacteria bacterium]|nr:ABC transporter permease [Vicinamibacteria bacterium]
MLESIASELRHAVRGLLRRPGYSLAVLLSLGFGLGAVTATFSFVNALLLRPELVGPRTERLRLVYATHPTLPHDPEDNEVSAPDLAELRTLEAFEGVAGLVERNFVLATDDQTDRVLGASVSPGLFTLLGVRPALGRDFREDEGAGFGFEPVAILSHALWERRYAADPGLVGRAIRVNGRELMVVGILPRGFRFPERQDLYVPWRATAADTRERRFLNAFALLHEGRGDDAAQAQLQALAARLQAEHPDSHRQWGFASQSVRELLVGDATLMISMLLGAALFVLAIVCANVANLQLARGAGRERELAVRAAVGAGRGHLVRHALAEALLLALAGGALGLALAQAWIGAWLAAVPEEMPSWLNLGLDARVVAFATAVAVVSGLAFGLVPALKASRVDVVESLKAGARESGSRGESLFQRGLVAGQVALGVALVAGATLLSQSLAHLHEADAGFDETPLLSLRTYLSGDAYDAPAARAAFFRRAAQAVAAVPGVEAAAFTGAIPADDGGASGRLLPEGGVSPADELGVGIVPVQPGLFRTLGTAPLAGRDFDASEDAPDARPVALVNPALAKRLFPRGFEGRRLGLVSDGAVRHFDVIGVAPELQYEEFGEETEQSALVVYVPYARLGWRSMALLVRAAGDPGAVADGVRAALAREEPGLAAYQAMTMRERRALTTWEQRFVAGTLGRFSLAALLLAALGAWGVMAYAVSRRTREIGVRLALGARPRDVMREIGGEGLRLAAIGAGAGLLLAAGVGRALSGALYRVSAADPAIYAGAALALVAAVGFACLGPARRAASVDPMSALRSE